MHLKIDVLTFAFLFMMNAALARLIKILLFVTARLGTQSVVHSYEYLGQGRFKIFEAIFCCAFNVKYSSSFYF